MTTMTNDDDDDDKDDDDDNVVVAGDRPGQVGDKRPPGAAGES